MGYLRRGQHLGRPHPESFLSAMCRAVGDFAMKVCCGYPRKADSQNGESPSRRDDQYVHWWEVRIVLTQPVDEGTAYIPHRSGDEVKAVLAFVADLFERTVVLELADVDPLRELFFFFP
jgi:hypothetical protein